jgi:putative endonuclease
LSADHCYYVHIMASRSRTLYTGTTNSLYHRVLQLKSGEIDGFIKKYNINRLVYYEMFEYIANALAGEKQVKASTRAKRLVLIKSINPTWQDLAENWEGKAQLQIPRFARDDNFLNESKPSMSENNADLNTAEVAPLHSKSKTV